MSAANLRDDRYGDHISFRKESSCNCSGVVRARPRRLATSIGTNKCAPGIAACQGRITARFRTVFSVCIPRVVPCTERTAQISSSANVLTAKVGQLDCPSSQALGLVCDSRGAGLRGVGVPLADVTCACRTQCDVPRMLGVQRSDRWRDDRGENRFAD